MSQTPERVLSLPVNSICFSTDSHTRKVGTQDHHLLSAIVNASDDAILSKTLDGIITTWNPAAERMFGYNAEEIIGRSETVLFPPDCLQEEQVILDRLRQGIPTNHFETVQLHRDGTTIPVSVTISPIKDEHRLVIGASTIARNITERKQNEEQVRLLSTVAAESVNGIVITDAQRRILYVNPAYERLTGYTLEELHGCRPGEVLQGPNTDQETKQRVREALDAKHPVMAGLLNYRKDGTPFWIEIHITPVKNGQAEVTHFIAIETDITYRVQAETTIRQHHDKMAALLEAIPDIIFRVNREGICLDNLGSNKPFALVTTQDVVGKPMRDFVPPHVAEIVQRGIDAAFATRKLQTLHYQFHMDGKTRYRDTRVVAQSEDVALLVIRDITDSKKLEEELREITMLQQAIFDSADYSIIATDPEGIILSFNRAAERMLGYSAEEVIGKVTPAIIHDADEVVLRAESLTQELGRSIAPGFDVFVARTGEGKPDENEWTYVRKDGSRFPVRLSVTALRDKAGALTGYLGIAKDITVRKQAEQALRDSEARFHAFINQGSLYAWITDAEGVIEYLNEPYCAMIGRTLEECVGKTVFDIYPAEVAQILLDNIRQVAQTGKVLETVETAPLPDGNLHYFLVHKFMLGEMIGRVLVGGSAVDITERKKTEDAMLVAEERLRLATESGALGVWEYDIVTNALTWDEHMMHLYGFTPETFPGAYRAWSEHLYPDDKARAEAELLEAIQGGRKFDTEFRIVPLDGTIRHIKANATVLKASDGTPIRMIGLNQDITAQKRLNTQLEQNLLLVQEQNVQLEWQQQELASANAHLETANEALASLATTDGLTGAKNHRAFQERLHEEFIRAERTKRPFSVILLDVDKFKSYNDNYGHTEGDRVLKQVVRVLQETAREIDLVARYGGEEFVVLLTETDKEGALEAAERFRAALERQAWPLRHITASFGVATLNATIETAQQLIDRADKALYASKEGGRNRVTHADALQPLTA